MGKTPPFYSQFTSSWECASAAGGLWWSKQGTANRSWRTVSEFRPQSQSPRNEESKARARFGNTMLGPEASILQHGRLCTDKCYVKQKLNWHDIHIFLLYSSRRCWLLWGLGRRVHAQLLARACAGIGPSRWREWASLRMVCLWEQNFTRECPVDGSVLRMPLQEQAWVGCSHV